VSDFNIVLSSVEGEHSNEVNDWFQHCLEFSWGRSLKRGKWFQHCLEFSWGRSLKRGEWLISTVSRV
jgi:hypothetical protein